MNIIDGKEIAKKLRAKIAEEVKTLDRPPGLAVILVGEDPASAVYVRNKELACIEAGFFSDKIIKSENTTEEQLLEEVERLNNNSHIDGILVQLPLPKHVDTNKILEVIDPKKDVDGFHPYNVGRLVTGLDSFAPCTPLGVMELFKEYNIDVKGLDACVVGASNIVGKPMQALLLNQFATVDICHIYTKNLKEHTERADIVVVGVGKPNLITADMVKEGAIVVDIGINRLENGKLVGDVDFENVSKKASFITPVPGGVGPMTIAMLLKNTIKAAKKFAEGK